MKGIIKPSLFILLMFLAVGQLSAVEKFVDTEKANKEIKELEDENARLKDDSDKQEGEIKKLQDKADAARKKIKEKIDTLYRKIDTQYNDLYQIYLDIIDKTMAEEAQQSLNRCYTLKKKLEKEKADLNAVIDTDERLISEKKSRITSNQNNILVNQQRIAYLKERIKVTDAQKKKLQEYLDNVKKFLNESEAILKK